MLNLLQALGLGECGFCKLVAVEPACSVTGEGLDQVPWNWKQLPLSSAPNLILLFSLSPSFLFRTLFWTQNFGFDNFLLIQQG